MSTNTLIAPLTYTIDSAHSTVNFSVRHLMISKVHGSFPGVSGTIVFDPADIGELKVFATIDVASVTTGQDQRDDHLKSPDFFDVQSFPTMTFQSRHARKTGDSTFDVVGDLTLHGVTREVVLTAEITDEVVSPFGGYKIGVSATTKVNREDFGMVWNQLLEAGGIAVGKEIAVQIDAELDRPA